MTLGKNRLEQEEIVEKAKANYEKRNETGNFPSTPDEAHIIKIQNQIRNVMAKKKVSKLRNYRAIAQRLLRVTSSPVTQTDSELISESLNTSHAFRGTKRFKYFGNKREDMKEGFGILKWEDNSKFTGIFKGDKAEGFGKLRHENFVYLGEFIKDKANGYGICDGSGNMRLEGLWVEDNLNGVGIEDFNNNNYSGEFVNGTKHGIGQYNWNDGSYYQGEWANNSMEGYGIYYFSSSRIFRGEFKNNMMTGYGEYVMNDRLYIGYFNKDLRDGVGLEFVDGKIFVGTWKADKRHGVGKVVHNTSSVFCLYEHGRKIKIINSQSDALEMLPKKSGIKRLFILPNEKLLSIKPEL